MNQVENVLVAMQAAQEQVLAGEPCAVAVSETGRWAGPHYWSDGLQREVFEQVVAQGCVEVGDRMVTFVTPVLVQEAEQRIDFRSPLEPPHDGEREELFGLAIDTDDGFDVLRCRIARDAEQVTFGDIEIFEGRLQLTTATPGFTLMRSLLEQSA